EIGQLEVCPQPEELVGAVAEDRNAADLHSPVGWWLLGVWFAGGGRRHQSRREEQPENPRWVAHVAPLVHRVCPLHARPRQWADPSVPQLCSSRHGCASTGASSATHLREIRCGTPRAPRRANLVSGGADATHCDHCLRAWPGTGGARHLAREEEPARA